MLDYEEFAEELDAVSEELNLFVKHGFAEKWEQLIPASSAGDTFDAVTLCTAVHF